MIHLTKKIVPLTVLLSFFLTASSLFSQTTSPMESSAYVPETSICNEDEKNLIVFVPGDNLLKCTYSSVLELRSLVLFSFNFFYNFSNYHID